MENMSYELHNQALSDVISTERAPEVGFHGKRDVMTNESLGKEVRSINNT